ncbi:thiol-disulfide oxidoreductase DCC family protein [Streptomyces sp. NPDC057363]|uniref:thiol-disulfide oxidoreductase DCC family protein n=1 Tax=Streptomyces sp. NPDC057363 TaxID=3346107 RepID=UPI0036452E76
MSRTTATSPAYPTSPAPATAGAPVRRLTVLYDAECSLCAHVRDWLLRQRRLVPMELVPAGSDEARRRLPGLDHATTLDEVTVVADAGQVYRGAAAWVVVLWALREHRPLAHRLSTPTGAVLARGAVLAAAKWRGAQFGGRAYRRADGWAYEPGKGWLYTGPGCDDGACASR